MLLAALLVGVADTQLGIAVHSASSLASADRHINIHLYVAVVLLLAGALGIILNIAFSIVRIVHGISEGAFSDRPLDGQRQLADASLGYALALGTAMFMVEVILRIRYQGLKLVILAIPILLAFMSIPLLATAVRQRSEVVGGMLFRVAAWPIWPLMAAVGLTGLAYSRNGGFLILALAPVLLLVVLLVELIIGRRSSI